MKVLSRPKGNAEEYGRWSVNLYKGCPHGCKYCYLKKGVWSNTLGGSKPELRAGLLNDVHAYHVAMVEILEHKDEIICDGGLFMSFITDPMCEENRTNFLCLAEIVARYGIPVTILTKSSSFASIPAFQRIFANNLIFCGWTLTGHDELEPNAPSNGLRIKAMNELCMWGCNVWASIEPVIDFDSSLDMIILAISAGCRHFKIGLLTNNTRVVRKDFSFGKFKFKAYDHDECIKFIHDVMKHTKGLATVYWKQSFREFLGEEDFARATVGYENIVGKDWTPFNLKIMLEIDFQEFLENYKE